MPNVLTIDTNGVQVTPGADGKHVRYQCVLSGAYVQAVINSNVGELLDLSKVVGINIEDQFWGSNGPQRGYPLQGPAGFSCEILPGADKLHWLLKVFASAGNEHNAGAYEAAILADTNFFIEFTGRSCD